MTAPDFHSIAARRVHGLPDELTDERLDALAYWMRLRQWKRHQHQSPPADETTTTTNHATP